jgi:hypothetical protein
MITPSIDGVSSTTPIHQLSTQDGTIPVAEILPTQDSPEINPQTPAQEAAEKNDERKRKRSQIEIPGLNRLVGDFAIDLGKSLPRGILYLYGSDVVEIQQPQSDSSESPIVPMETVRFRTWIENFVEPYKLERKGNMGMAIPRTLSEGDSKAVLVNDRFKEKLQRIDRVINFPMPILRDGEVFIPEPGYNDKINTYLQPTAPKIKSDMDIQEARSVILDDVLGEFCFRDDDQSRVHAIAWILTPYFRGIMGLGKLTPFWSFRANRPRAGKDYLAQTSHLIYAGQKFEDAALPENDMKGFEKSEETRKRITSMFNEGRRFGHFANCSGYVDDKFFIQAITAPSWSDRILGKTSLKTWKNEMQLSLSGNMDLLLKSDLEPRSREVVLEFFEEDANDRKFSKNLHDWILQNRERILSAIHAIFRHWVDCGMPKGETPFTSFPEWAAVIGGVMTCSGIDLGNPCLPHAETSRHVDPEFAAMSALYGRCHEIDVNNGDEKGSWWTLQELYDEVESNWEDVRGYYWFSDYFKGEDGKLNRKSFSKFLRKCKGRMVNRIKLELDDRASKSQDHKVRFRPNTKS